MARAAFIVLLALVLVLTLGPGRPKLEGRASLRLQSAVDRHRAPADDAPEDGGSAARARRDRALLIADITDAMANIALFVPLGVALALGWPSRTWRLVVLLSGLSATIELVQAVALTSRSAQLSDWVSNSVGAAAGFMVARGAVRLAR